MSSQTLDQGQTLGTSFPSCIEFHQRKVRFYWSAINGRVVKSNRKIKKKRSDLDLFKHFAQCSNDAC